MICRGSIYAHCLGALAVAASWATASDDAWAFDEAKYPAIESIWRRVVVPGQPAFDPSKPRGLGQQAPLTPEYQANFEANLADLAKGGEGNWPGYSCLPPGMPAMMNGYEPLDIIIRPDVTYILIDHIHDSHRRIYTDGRDWPEASEPTFTGYSIGKWVDENGDGRYDALEVETRYIKGKRAYDASGLPLHEDGETVVKEKLYLDKDNQNLLHDQITVFDHALTRPWTVVHNFNRDTDKYPTVGEYICAEDNSHIHVGNENYYLSADGFLMPAKKDQAPPDLRYFNAPKK
jgi:hypothetical protein